MGQSQGVFVRHVSRREFLARIGGTAVAIPVAQLLAACGDAEPESQVGGRLDFYSWEGYDMLEATEAWRADNGVNIESSYISSSLDIPTRIVSPAGKGIDIITSGSVGTSRDRNLGILSEIRPEDVPEVENFYTIFQEGPEWVTERGTYTSIPFSWGAICLNFRPDMTDKPTRWADLLEPEYRGKIAMMNDPNALLITGSLVLGYQPPNLTTQQLAEVQDFLLQIRSQSRTIAQSYGDLTNLFVSGEIVASFAGWSAINVFAAGQDTSVECTVPEEGIMTFVDALAIPPEADNRATALAWINLMSTKEIQAKQAENLAAGVVRPDAVAEIASEEVRNLYPYDDLDGYLAGTLFEVPPEESSEGFITYEDWVNTYQEVTA